MVIDYYDEALKNFSDHLVLLYNKWNLFFSTDNYEEAMKLMDKILERNSGHIDALLLKSWILSIIWKTEECKDRAEKMKSTERL